MTDHVAAHLANTRKTPLGSRQAAILTYARDCVALGQRFPEIDQLAARCHAEPRGVLDSLLGLMARGYIVATDKRQGRYGTQLCGWHITEAGWQA